MVMRKALWMRGACAWALVVAGSAAPAWAQQQTDQDGDAAQATDGSTAEAGAARPAVAAVAAAYDVADLSIQEPDIEDVIRELYAR